MTPFKRFFATLSLLLFSLLSFAQHTGSIRGRVVIEKSAEQIPVSIALLRAKDSSVIKVSATDKAGNFVFENIAFDKYLVTVTAVGYKKIVASPSEVSAMQPNIQVQAIQLVPTTKIMQGVTVAAKKPFIEQKVDRMIVNVEAAVTNVGASALEVLEKSPGVVVDKDGNISLKGKEGVLVMVDGRPTQLGGTDLANLLRNLHANQLDQIEIMTNPPARYEAAGNAGIINIKTKKLVTAGYNGSANISLSQGRYPKTAENFTFNYRDGKLNVFTNLSHNFRRGFNLLTIQRNLRNSTTNELENYFDQHNDRFSEGNSYSGKIGLDYFAGKRTTVGVVFNGFYSPSFSTNINQTNISTSLKELESITKAAVTNTSSWKNFSTNVNFRRQFDSTGKELSMDLDYLSYTSTNSQWMINALFDADGNPLHKIDSLLGSLPQDITIYSGQADYTHPLKKGARFEAGIKTSFVKTDNNARYDSLLYGRTVLDVNRSNHFIYEENINAAYVNLSRPLTKKLSVQTGLRLENTNATGRQMTTGQNFDRHYTQLFPTAYVQYKANAKNNFGLNYGRRLRRPNYESLNPFIRFLDRYTYSQGNPDLKPQFSHNIELSHSYNNMLTTTINYTATNDIIQQVIEQKGTEAYAKQANIASLRQLGLSLNFNKAWNKWWTANVYANVYNNAFKGIVNNTPVSLSYTSFSINSSQQFTLSKTVAAEISGVYRSAGVEGVIKMKSRGMLMAGFSQQLLKNKATLRLTVRDIFYTQIGRATIKYSNVDAAFQESGDSRVVNVGFTYRFSKGKTGAQRKKPAGSASEEQNRVGVD